MSEYYQFKAAGHYIYARSEYIYVHADASAKLSVNFLGETITHDPGSVADDAMCQIRNYIKKNCKIMFRVWSKNPE